jgi:hypothetical protein
LPANEPPCYYSYGPVQPGWKVNRKAKFHGTFHIGTATGTVTGKLKSAKNHYQKIIGTLSVQGSCDTGTLDHAAKKGG